MAKSESRKERRRRWKRRVRALDPVKWKAWQKLTRAVARGRLVKPKDCPGCGKLTPKESMTGHHTDLTKPLLVKWLCVACHLAEHAKERVA